MNPHAWLFIQQQIPILQGYQPPSKIETLHNDTFDIYQLEWKLNNHGYINIDLRICHPDDGAPPVVTFTGTCEPVSETIFRKVELTQHAETIAKAMNIPEFWMFMAEYKT
jgi:hypothetical protein